MAKLELKTLQSVNLLRYIIKQALAGDRKIKCELYSLCSTTPGADDDGDEPNGTNYFMSQTLASRLWDQLYDTLML